MEQRQLLAGDTWEAAIEGRGYVEVASDSTGHAVTAVWANDQFSLDKFSPTGQELWSESLDAAIDGSQGGRIYDVQIDAAGQIYVAGMFRGTVDFDPGSVQQQLTSIGDDGFIAKFSDQGSTIALDWVHQFGDVVRDLEIGPSSDIVAVGEFGTALDFDSTQLLANKTGLYKGGFLARMHNDGSLDWVRQIEDAGTFRALSVDLATDGEIFVGGSNHIDNPDAMNPKFPTVTIDGQTLPKGGGGDGYVLRFDQDEFGASFNSAYHFGEGVDNESVVDLKLSSADVLYVLGANMEGGNFSFAGTTFSNGYIATVVAKVDLSSGSPATEWVRLIQPDQSTRDTARPSDLSLYESETGEVTAYVAGTFAGTIDFDPSSNSFDLSSRNVAQVPTFYSTIPEGFVFGLDSDGVFTRAWQMGERGGSVDTHLDGTIFAAGWYFDHSENIVTKSLAGASGGYVVGINPEQPTVVFDPPSEMGVGESVTVTANAYDLNSNDIAANIEWTDSLGNILGAGPTVTLSGFAEGRHSITAMTTDVGGRSGSFTFMLTVEGDPNPTVIPDQGTLVVTQFVSPAEALVVEDVNVTLDITHSRAEDLDVFLIAPDGTRVELFTDVGNGSNFTETTLDDEAANSVTQYSSPLTGLFRPEGNLSDFDGKNSEGTWSLEITDDRRRQTGALNSWSLDITGSPVVPNDPPEITSTPATSATQDAAYIYDVNANDPDAGDILSYSLVDSPDGMNIDPVTGEIDWTPTANQVGQNDVTVRVDDQRGAFGTQSFTIDVANVNDAPVANDDGYSTHQDTPLTIAAAGVLSNDFDVDGDSLSVVLNSDPANGSVVVNSDGSFSYTPNPGFTGTDSFSYQISDSIESSNLATVTLAVEAPVTDEALYVYDISFESKRGNKDWRAVFEIRSDSNSNELADSGDGPAAGIAITVRFGGETFTGVTDSSGVFGTAWIRNLASGNHYANVDSLYASGFLWDPFDSLNQEDDSDDDGLPDGLLVR